MIKRTLKYFWSIRKQFTKYAIVGISGVAFDMASLVLLKELFGVNPTIAVVVNQAFVLVYIFTLNKYWSFRNTDLPRAQVVRFLLLAGWNYVFAVLMMFIFNERYGLDYKLVRIGSIAVMVSWNFLLYKYWVYRDTSHESHTTSQ
ncbi:MAG: hypothetical protein A3C90_04490 [Candidatus Magasanikbacteria bacterium RIFCSPHIGHO2_02_FULL_51_14]|uniref:GtrA/DPMS transmembrane domain-containing protein n=1 Tax=Candidatus Magasanikbacteria bacterium RIFCSPHIGHO2_02_FULL_51_14 TaxID=1798683 RepID=A0A1F6MQ48_9BACT|nr:MAG: hypothetical protein A3C90_04490 [Candidatus Magasanikbacteria bacterium RIFCSPHIGHO2_02_FULL_51_14]